MAYDVTKSDGTRLTIVPDRTVDTTSSISLIGKNYAGYGEIMAENLVHIMEHFSSPVAPSNPIVGQFWWNSETERLYVYTATDETADGWVPLNPPLERISTKTANYTVTKEDHGVYLRMNSTGALAVTLPAGSTIPVGTKVTIVQAGTGEVSITGATGVSVFSSGGNTIDAQWGRVFAVKTAADVWEINGDLSGITYAVSVSSTSITEGQSVTYTVVTSRLDNHTVYWTLSGTVGTNDFSDGLGTSGSISMSNGTGTLVRQTSNDGVYESATETMILQVRTTSTAGTIVAIADTVTITETSTAPTTTTSTTTAGPTTTTTTQAPYWVYENGACVMNGPAGIQTTTYPSLAACLAANPSATTTSTTTAAPYWVIENGACVMNGPAGIQTTTYPSLAACQAALAGTTTTTTAAATTTTTTTAAPGTTTTTSTTTQPQLVIQQFSLVPSVADDGDTITAAVQSNIGNEILLRRSIGGGSYVDVAGSFSSYYPITPGVINTGIPAGNADYATMGSTVDYLLIVRQSSTGAQASATRQLTINPPAGLIGFLVPQFNSINAGQSMSVTLLTPTEGTYSIQTGAGSTGGASYSPSTVTTFIPGGEIEANAVFQFNALSAGTVIIEARQGSTLVASYEITVLPIGGPTPPPINEN